MTQTPPIVLVFAGNDPSAGAGLAADILTLSALGCHPLPVVTAVTVQDTAGMEDFQVVEADWVSDQARLLLEDMPVAAIKVGVLGSVENLTVVAEIAADYPDIPLILDPVFATGGGDEFASEELIAAMRELLLPHTTVLTPNSLEARRLASDDADEQEGLTPDEAALRIRQFGPEFVLVTGTHENTPTVNNVLYNRSGRVRADSWERLPHSYHGSGCTLASALAAFLANGMEMSQAAREAQEFTYHALKNAYRPGMGQMIPDRMFWARGSGEDSKDEGEGEPA
ncbi:bifunctional hydroxymethylpyrimidine kinase/phosphomethylpyrimidine kinase [Chitinimonas koreensis]|uniref:bifunctional hydroxymethylpyrimidine kinase/phosphomethylpyrimidine kinase n=1 Tax=Chitinimonas koreensis TaxID=356302 RepID=UPI00048BBA91|nr:hydroxymethylpyrimidine/phosphomethylpyrimidine kinase [Chitinimonas koreensis]QNM96554.1 hydroxymethylpyrimidine/phosphomethylpyrimidine kinase [Chitinimonas koreensis]